LASTDSSTIKDIGGGFARRRDFAIGFFGGFRFTFESEIENESAQPEAGG
jgi:hypothetical protein